MKTLYLDLISGISGDMFIGALLDLGVDSRQLESELSKLNVGGYHLHTGRSRMGSIAGIKFDVHVTGGGHAGHEHPHEHAVGYDHGHSHAHEHEAGAHAA